MKNTEILESLISIKSQITELGIKHLENQMPIVLTDVGRILKPFTDMDSAVNLAIKKLTIDNPGLIPKANTLKS